MHESEFKQKYSLVCDHIMKRRLSYAIETLDVMFSHMRGGDVYQEYLQTKETFDKMLSFAFSDVNDQEQERVFSGIQTRLLAYADYCLSNKNAEQEKSYSNSIKRYIEKQLLKNQSGVEYYFEQLLNPENNRQDIVEELFNYIWLKDLMTEFEVEILLKPPKKVKLGIAEKSLIIGASILSLLRYFDPLKFKILFRYLESKSADLRGRALVGVVLTAFVYNKRLSLYPQIGNRLKLLPETAVFKEIAEHTILQLLKTRETPKISEILRNEIIPEMNKLKPKITDKLNLDKIISDKLIEDKNPEWEEIFDEAPDLLNKMAEFSQLQLDGTDVFMSAFSELKNFPFFSKTSNWFLPFYKENKEILPAFGDEDEHFDASVFLGGLERSVYMCNSDKYSFCLNIGMMPSVQKKMIMELFKMEASAMDEIDESDKKIDSSLEIRQIVTRYIQDVYRFFKLHPARFETGDIFDSRLDVYNSDFFASYEQKDKIILKAAEFLLKKEFFADAADAFLKLRPAPEKLSGIYEKIGYSMQRFKKYDTALDYYDKAELCGSKSLWLRKKIAFCSRKTGHFEKALEYYKKAEVEQPDNLHIQANIGHCRVELEQYEEALKSYFKVEYFDPENTEVMRPLAWCSLLTGKFDTAEKYYKKIIEKKSDTYDFIHYAHVLFAKKERAKASELYLKALAKSSVDIVTETIEDESKHLEKLGVTQNEIRLLIDFLKIKSEKVALC